MVLNREQVAKLKHAIDINPMDSVRATISAENLSDVLQRMRERGPQVLRLRKLVRIRRKSKIITLNS